ncbi:Metallopeptidase M20 [Homalodisca vitripennis]|nr:Metallopeptidase M20 [Homalodisca vitripennis]
MGEDYMEKLYRIIDQKRGSYLDVLKEAVSIRSETGDQAETKKVISWAETKLRELGAATTSQDVGAIIVEGKKVKLPPVLIADIKSDPSKVTLLVYGHLDVRPSRGSRSTIETAEDYNLIEEDGVLFGKGVTDSKGPLLCWFNAIGAYREYGVELPINLRFVIEAMKESGSLGLLDYIHSNKDYLFKNVSYICISDSSCLCSTRPVITFGGRGCCKFMLTVEGGKVDLHSGVHGGMVSEPMNDLMSLLCSLTDNKGEIQVPNFRDNVEEVTPDEEKAYHRMSFDVTAFKRSVGVGKLLHKEDKKRLLMHSTRFPSLSIHSIDTRNCDDDAIPSKVTASFTIRIVPNQTPQEVFHKVQVYLMYLFNRTQSPNQMTIEMPVAIPPWIAKPNDGNYKSASKAMHRVYKQEPDLIREGSSIPIVSELQKVSGKSVLLLPVGCSTHSVLKNRDRVDVKTFMDGTKVVATYMYELAQQKKVK